MKKILFKKIPKKRRLKKIEAYERSNPKSLTNRLKEAKTKEKNEIILYGQDIRRTVRFGRITMKKRFLTDRRVKRTFPDLGLTSEQIEGMFYYGESLKYLTPSGVLDITPDKDQIFKGAKDRRKREDERYI